MSTEYKGAQAKEHMVSSNLHTTATNDSRYDPVSTRRPDSKDGYEMRQSKRMSKRSTASERANDESRERLMDDAASMGGRDPSPGPKLPNVELRSYR